MTPTKRLTDLDAAFAALNEAAEFERSENSARDAVTKYREACSRLDSYATTLPPAAPERTLLVNRREHYRDRARVISERLLPVAVAIDPSSKRTRSSDGIPLADELYYEEADEALARARCESDGDGDGGVHHQPIADAAAAPPPTHFPPPSAPPLEEIDPSHLQTSQVPSSIATNVDKADAILKRALSMDEGGKKRSKVINTYVEAGEVYLEAIRLSEGGETPEGDVHVALLKKKLNMILGRIEELKKADSTRDRGWLNSRLSSRGGVRWSAICNACAG